MATAIELLTGKKFVSELDTDKVKTKWILRSLTSFEFIECTSGGFVDHSKVLHYGLTGWENFKDSKKKQIEFSEDAISMIPASILADISFEIQIMSSMSEKERKNL